MGVYEFGSNKKQPNEIESETKSNTTFKTNTTTHAQPRGYETTGSNTTWLVVVVAFAAVAAVALASTEN